MFKMNKKVMAMTMAFAVMAGTFAGCGGSGDSAEEKAPVAGSDEPVTYTINLTQNIDLFDQWHTKFAEEVTRLSDGRITFEVIPACSIGSATESLTACQMGTVDFVNGGSDELGSIVANSDWAQLPFFINSHEQAQEVYLDGFIGEYADAQYAESGLISVSRIDNSFRTVGITEGELNGPEDLAGLRIRVPNQPLALEIYERMGALPVAIAAPEVLMSLEQGTIDGLDQALWLLDKTNVYDYLSSVALVNYGFGTINIFCSAETWATMSEEDQAIMKEAGDIAADWFNAERLAYEEELTAALIADGKKVIEPDAAWLASMHADAEAIWDEALTSGKYDEEFITQLHELYLENCEG